MPSSPVSKRNLLGSHSYSGLSKYINYCDSANFCFAPLYLVYFANAVGYLEIFRNLKANCCQ